MARALGTRARFAIAYLLMGAAVGAGLGAFIVLVKRPGPGPAPAWSSWQPGSSSREAQVFEIANHVGSSYRLATGDQLNAVKIGPPNGAGSVRAIAVPKTSQPKTLADFDHYDSDKSVIYVLCGAAKNCSIPEGKPSRARGTVLRREALELALYTMKYEKPIDNVLVFFPPGTRKEQLALSLFFHRKQLSGRLDHPLRRTLPQANPPLPGKISETEQQTVDALTSSSLYRLITIANAPAYGKLLVVQPVA
jgi:hypothetical protein